eukprot:SAG31_NODE_5637_length_2411_cov_2.066609_3_plen_133_part_00
MQALRCDSGLQDLDGRHDLPHGGIANSIADPVQFNLTDPQRVAVETMQAGGAPQSFSIDRAEGAPHCMDMARTDVFVIDARGETRCGTMGAILATRMDVRGVAGLVTDGESQNVDLCYQLATHLACLDEHVH